MTKRLISLMLAMVMLLSLCMTACSSETSSETAEGEEGVAVETQRKNLALTIYAITDGKTTDEGLAIVEEKISNYCVAKYKTAIDLRFFTEEEYQAGLNDMYDKFAAKEAEQKKAEQEAAAIVASQNAYKATLSKEERQKYEQELRLKAKEEAEAAEQKKKEEAELIEEGKDVAKVEEVQMDILFIPNMTEYYNNVDQGMLLDIKKELDGNFKTIKDYVFPSFLTAATVDGSIYGIPNNYGIAGNETYLLVNTAMAEKYGVDLTKVRSITDLEPAFAQVVAGEAGVTPIYGDFDPEGVFFLDGIGLSKAACVYMDTLVGGKFNTENMYTSINPKATNSPEMVKYFQLKADYKAAGYISETNQNFFASAQSLTFEEKAEWEKKGYTALTYRGADFNTEAALQNGLFGLSKYCKEPERAMEILKLMYTDPDFRNLLAFGVEEVNYIVRADAEADNIITIVDDSYSMDYFKAGNSLIGYLPDTMDPNYIEQSKEKNLNSFMNPTLGFRFDKENEDAKKWFQAAAEWDAYYEPIYQQLKAGDPNYLAVLEQVYGEIYTNNSGLFSECYKNFSANYNFRTTYAAYLKGKITELDKILHFENVVAPVAPEA